MVMRTIGDQARAFTLQNSAVRLKGTLNVLTEELNSGRVNDVAQRLQGNTRELSAIEGRIRLLTQFRQTKSEAALAGQTMQSVLEALHSSAEAAAASIMIVGASRSPQVIGSQSLEASLAFGSVVARLNTEVGGAYLFSGIETDRPPLMDGDLILDELTTQTAGMTTAADVQQFVEDWFEAPSGGGGYLDFAYRGSLSESRDVRLSEYEEASFQVDASSQAVRTVLKGLAMTALAGRGMIAGQLAEQRLLTDASALTLLGGTAQLTAESAGIGYLEERIENAGAENEAALASLETARNVIVSADPYATAVALAEVQTQMQTLYSMTARLSNLNLVDYLR